MRINLQQDARPVHFIRILVTGETHSEAYSAASGLCRKLKPDLPKGSVIWPPQDLGYLNGGHTIQVSVTLGLDELACLETIKATICDVEASSGTT